MDLTKFRCISCGSDQGAPGMTVAEGWTKMIFVPADAPRMNRWLSQGAAIEAIACRKCGCLHLFTDVEKVEQLTGEGETRCRRCRYILKGLSEPRCPECGEPI